MAKEFVKYKNDIFGAMMGGLVLAAIGKKRKLPI